MRSETRQGKSFTILGSFVCALSLALPLPVLAEVEKPLPKLSVPQSEYRFEPVPAGSRVKHSFKIENRGDAELVIERVIPSCGCTASTASRNKIPAGQSAELNVEFDSTGFSGEKLKTVTVVTNDPHHSSVTFTLRGKVEEDVTIRPARISFDEISRSDLEGARQEVTVTVREGSGTVITGIKNLSRNLAVEELDGSLTSRRFKVGLSSLAKEGEIRDRVIIEVSRAGRPHMLNLPVFAVVNGDYKAIPSSLSFGVIDPNVVAEREIVVKATGKAPLDILGVRSDSAALRTELEIKQPSREYVIKVKLDPRRLGAATELKATVTADLGAGALPIVVYGVVAAAS